METQWRFEGQDLKVGDRFALGRTIRLRVKDASSLVLLREGRIGTVVALNARSVSVQFEGSTRVYHLRKFTGHRV
jgi:hypothetical protein